MSDVYNPYSTYNKLFFLYTHPTYLHCDKENQFIMLPTNQFMFDLNIYSNINQMFFYNRPNSSYFYHHMLYSIYHTDETMAPIFDLFCKLQKFKLGFSRFVHLCKLRYTKKYNSQTLLFEPFQPANSIMIHENNCVYTFSDTELFQIIESAFNYNDFGLPVILPIKNPYTNIPFSFYNIIYMYFELLKRGKNSIPFSLYFKCNFNTEKVLILFKPQLYVNHLNKKFDNFTNKRKEKLMYQMITDYDDKYESFENVRYVYLDYLFGFYVKSYYIYREFRYNFSSRFYSLSSIYEKLFRDRLEKVYKNNPSFGRKIYAKQMNGKYTNRIDEYTILMPYNL